MAELIGYTLVNGSKAINEQYYAKVNSQEEIEQHRKRLSDLNPGKKIFFVLRQKGSNFKC